MIREKFTLVIPCYNEAKRLPLEKFAQFLKKNPQARLCFVDDGSRDGTRAVLEEFCAKFSNVAEVVALPQNNGKAEAVRVGMLRFLENGEGECAGFWDADLATPLEESLRFAEVLKNYPNLQFVFGSRQQTKGARIERNPARAAVADAVAFFIRRIIKFPVRDSQCGAKMFRRGVVEKLFGAPFVSRWLFDVELFKRVNSPKDRVYEMALAEWRDVPGSKLKFYHGLKIIGELFRIAWHYREPRHEHLAGVEKNYETKRRVA